MELRNADGGPAEMSGNGIRCLAQAAVDAGLVKPPTFAVATGAGVRDGRVPSPATRPGWATASVDMGAAVLGPDQPRPSGGRRARQVDMGNPHLVLLGPDPSDVDVAELGPRLQEVPPAGSTSSSSPSVRAPTPSTCGSGSGASVRPWPAGPAAPRPPPPPGAGAWWVSGWPCTIRVAPSRST